MVQKIFFIFILSLAQLKCASSDQRSPHITAGQERPPDQSDWRTFSEVPGDISENCYLNLGDYGGIIGGSWQNEGDSLQELPTLVKHRSDGSLDTQFGVDGLSFVATNGSIADIILHPNGNIIIASGYIKVGSKRESALFSFNKDGVLIDIASQAIIGGDYNTEFGEIFLLSHDSFLGVNMKDQKKYPGTGFLRSFQFYFTHGLVTKKRGGESQRSETSFSVNDRGEIKIHTQTFLPN